MNCINDNQREAEVSVSYEGSAIVFEDLLGNLGPIQSKAVNGNKSSKTDQMTIEDLFDDIFNVQIDESETASMFTDNEEEQSIEGFDANNPTFTMPSDTTDNVDVFDTILQDLDEKAKEFEDKKNKGNIDTEQQKKTSISLENGNKIGVDEWEFDDKNVRKNIRVLLSTLHYVLPEKLQNKWKVIKMSDLLNDKNIKKKYRAAILMVHPDKAMARGDTEEIKNICNDIFQALEQAKSND